MMMMTWKELSDDMKKYFGISIEDEEKCSLYEIEALIEFIYERHCERDKE